MTIKQVWQATDGGIFDTEEQARQYEFKQELISGIYATCKSANTGAIADWLLGNYRIAKIDKSDASYVPPPPPLVPVGPHNVPIPEDCALDELTGCVLRKSDGVLMLWNGVRYKPVSVD